MIAMIGRVREKMDAALNKGDLIISVNGFIPKPFTPFPVVAAVRCQNLETPF